MTRSDSGAKFAPLDALIADARRSKYKVVFVPSPQTLGDTYEELIANLDKLADADLGLHISPARHRGGGGPAEQLLPSTNAKSGGPHA